ncbi:DUF6056 family protein [Streptomyces fradiae]|uniref:Uncharacterized protein n=1 Tax=Streptomyces fradiae ATCC 10745 = DSM 40063 TaxID=1319510 RepID=A0A1Y2NWJ2_STRFR|nr:DUF6056 family protein [Streptomyces fradiae]KAF0646390.1 hypothetical protein K701_28980 [Streptomyces fradiae ATCC 10745 = DSM 40063]OSY51399.1 hypothetical protein BG846_02979 [Streptomyces fradiae ATCC 10745 = DSM 40063]QEV10772.1 hypothetical protein CP974_00655 [Streptomyces fradiae ATCC 10745 = DSM 40063]
MAVGAPRVTDPDDEERRDGRGPLPARPAVRAAVAALAALPLALLAAAGALGWYVRPSADEWCFLPLVRDHGVAGIVERFYATDNGRLANGLLVGLYAKFPVAGHQAYAAVSAAVMLGLLWALTALLLRRAGLRAPRGTALLTAAVATALFLLATPNTYKTFYWPAASVSHTLAPVLAAGAALPLLAARSRRGRAAALVTALVAGVFLGTLSEEASVVALVVLGAVVVLAPWVLAERVRRFVRVWALTGAAGVAAGTLLLVTSPGSRNRRERYDAESVSMLAPDSLVTSLELFARVLATVLTTWTYAGAVAAGALLGLLARRGPDAGPAAPPPCRPLRLLALGALAFLVSGYLCTVITYPVFGTRVLTTERTWNDYLLLYVLLLTAAGALAGRAVRRAGRPARARCGVAAVCAAVCAATVAGLAVPLYGLGGDMRARAERWDAQDRFLRERAASGARTAPYTPNSVSRMLEPFGAGGRNRWPADCVADYYRLDRVTDGRAAP